MKKVIEVALFLLLAATPFFIGLLGPSPPVPPVSTAPGLDQRTRTPEPQVPSFEAPAVRVPFLAAE